MKYNQFKKLITGLKREIESGVSLGFESDTIVRCATTYLCVYWDKLYNFNPFLFDKLIENTVRHIRSAEVSA